MANAHPAQLDANHAHQSPAAQLATQTSLLAPQRIQARMSPQPLARPAAVTVFHARLPLTAAYVLLATSSATALARSSRAPKIAQPVPHRLFALLAAPISFWPQADHPLDAHRAEMAAPTAHFSKEGHQQPAEPAKTPITSSPTQPHPNNPASFAPLPIPLGSAAAAPQFQPNA